MRIPKVLLRAFGVEGSVVEDVLGDEADDGTNMLVISVRPTAKEAGRCPHCGRPSPGYDAGGGRRRWRTLDCGLLETYIEADAPRVRCREHGVSVARMPWARHGVGFTYAFEDTVAWLVTRTDKTTLSDLMRIAWRTVCAIIDRVVATAQMKLDPFGELTRIGIDEVSYRKGHRYLTVVIDHDTGRLLWASPGRDEKTLEQFFNALGTARSAQILFVSADAAAWIANVVARRCPSAVLCLDPFHVVQWATKALDEVRRRVWNDLRSHGGSAAASSLKHARWALWKNWENLTGPQEESLAVIEQINQPLYRAYLLKEQLRGIFKLKGASAMDLLDVGWLGRRDPGWNRSSASPARYATIGRESTPPWRSSFRTPAPRPPTPSSACSQDWRSGFIRLSRSSPWVSSSSEGSARCFLADLNPRVCHESRKSARSTRCDPRSTHEELSRDFM